MTHKIEKNLEMPSSTDVSSVFFFIGCFIHMQFLKAALSSKHPTVLECQFIPII